MEGHYIRGVGDGSMKALDAIPFEILPGTSEEAAGILSGRPDTTERLTSVSELVNGYESTYGLELLATVHSAATRSEEGERYDAQLPLDEIEKVVASWNRRKGQLFTSKHIAVAADRLRRLGWLSAPGPEGLFAPA
jgi:hypothetical protein